MVKSRTPTLAPQLLRPFERLLRDLPKAHEVLDALRSAPRADGRLSARFALDLLERAAERAAVTDLGLRAALCTQLGDFEVLEWVASSAATWRDANLTICRYVRVLNEAADYRLEVRGDKAHLMLGSALPLGRIAADYQIAVYQLAISLRFPETPPELEVFRTHSEPEDMSLYRAIFPTAKLVFGAPFDGFVSDAWRLDQALPSANEPLHRVLREHADHLLAARSDVDSLVQRVEAQILADLRDGNAAAARTAARLGMSRRTLSRQLAERGTSYSQLLQRARYRAAIYYLRNTDRSIEDIAFLLGFSECSPFVRAFTRWSGRAPLAYRKSVS